MPHSRRDHSYLYSTIPALIILPLGTYQPQSLRQLPKTNLLHLSEQISKANRWISSLYESSVACPFSDEHQQLIPERDKELLAYLVNRHDMVNVQICCELSNGSKETVAALSFIQTSQVEFVILLAAVTEKLYDNSFGSGNDGRPFRRRGLFSFLVHFVCLFVLSGSKDITKSPIVVHTPVLSSDPCRALVLKPMGFCFTSATIKFVLRLFGTTPVEPLPATGNELVYSFAFGKDSRYCGTINQCRYLFS